MHALTLKESELTRAISMTGLISRATVALFSLLLVGCVAQETALPEPVDRLSRLLVEATRTGRVQEVRDLLGRGASPDSIEPATDGGDTALIRAVKRGNPDLVGLLIAGGARVNLRQGGAHDGVTPLIVAASAGHTDIVKLLIVSGANVNARTGIYGTQPGALHWAVVGDHGGVVNLLLSEGAFVDRRDVYEAIRAGRAELVSRLLAGGGDPFWRLSTGRTVMEEAERSPKATREDVIAAVRPWVVPLPSQIVKP